MSSEFCITAIKFAHVPKRRPGQILAQRIKDHVPRGKGGTLSALAGLAAETFSSWKTGKRFPNPRISELEELAEAFGVAVAYLISDEVGPDGRALLTAVEQKEIDRLREIERGLREMAPLLSEKEPQ